MRKHVMFFSFVIVVIACTMFMSANAHSASVKERMAARLPTINALKDDGAVGENSDGFLEYRSAARPQQEVVTAENEDRRRVYEAIGRQQGASPELVGQRRAKMIVDAGKQGHWFEKADGSWYRK